MSLAVLQPFTKMFFHIVSRLRSNDFSRVTGLYSDVFSYCFGLNYIYSRK